MDPGLVQEGSRNSIDLVKDVSHGSCQCVTEAYFNLDTEVALLESVVGEVVPVSGYFFRLGVHTFFVGVVEQKHLSAFSGTNIDQAAIYLPE